MAMIHGKQVGRLVRPGRTGGGGVVGAAGGLDTVEPNLACELAPYLERCLGAAGAPAANGEGAP